ncbi:kinesin family protein [Aspergillus indologenus CBS 114.80]|uniref:Kinesin family protein n=1 Tax=Aspergillus indologenus CBS 114.80 TaxID=1450541 RepID=A0A2V5J268_9EURO|nr:kinesin family protein [Aspergillus indologenus CBS 114.80]
MASTKSPPTSLFQVYLRLRPPMSQHEEEQAERCLTIESAEQVFTTDDNHQDAPPTHITLQPPSDSRKRAVERFGFTQVFDESASQLGVFEGTGLESLIKGVLSEGRDGLVATLGVTGSGKSHTILGSKTQRGITQMSLDVIFRSLASTIRPLDNFISPLLLSSVAAADASEAQIFSAQTFLEAVYGESLDRGRSPRAQTPMSAGRAQTPMAVRSPFPQPILQPTPRSRALAPTSCQLPAAYGPRTTSKPTFGGSPTPGLPNPLFIRYGGKTPDRKLPGSHLTTPHGRWNRYKTCCANSPSCSSKEPMPALIFPRRQMPLRAGALPRSPDVSHLTMELNPHSEYVVLVSMYEVYNDRIFDLLSPAIVPGQGSTMTRPGGGQKDRRRPLFFKSTEGSPDRKVVAGLRKIACCTYEEALSVLEVGLTERKVAGTGANSVSSRSHGFFCLEVKRRMRNKRTGEETWMGNTLTVADLAGSERARTAKTAGSTLAEAGKINESLMYLGQCLQMQSDIQEGNKATMVPFRQCKLTELLFSNSFPSPGQAFGQFRHPQKAIMIVTANPWGDYNATSQILRYSALAREVAVPRAPSATESILSSTLESRHGFIGGRESTNSVAAEELEKAAAEIERLRAENENLSVRLAEEEVVRTDLAMRLKASEEMCLTIEQDVREECWNEMDERMEEERRRWQSAWDEQTGHNEEHLDKKLELFSRGFQIYEDPNTTNNERMEELEFENEQLRKKVAALERELTCRSPTKKTRAKTTTTTTTLEPSRNSNILGRESDIENALKRMDQLKLADSMFSPATQQLSSPGKKHRKMATRKWDLAPEEDIY